MSDHGKHKITSSTPPPPPPDNKTGPIQKFFNVVFFIFIIFGTVKSCTEPSQSPSAPTPPTPLRPGLAVFESANSLGATPLAIVLGGGNYELIYQTVTNLIAQLDALSSNSNSVFTANFKTGKTSGNLLDADTLVLIGSLKLQVGILDNNDFLYANILNRGNSINAYFNYSTSPRGPPINTFNRTRKKIIIIGELKDVQMGDSYGDSTRYIRILDLNPSESDEKIFKEATARYENEIFKFKEKQTFDKFDAYRQRVEPHSAHR